MTVKKINGAFYGIHRKKFDLIVIRINKHSQLGNSRPCYNCLDLMKTVGINNVFYTTGNDDEMICENVKDMISIESSSSTIHYDSLLTPRPCMNLTNHVSFVDSYFENLLKKVFPQKIKHKNLVYFIQYNYCCVCPNFSFKINLQNQVVFYNSLHNVIVKSSISDT